MIMKLRNYEDYTEADEKVLWFDMRNTSTEPVYLGYKEDRLNYSPPESIKWARVPALPVKCTVKMPPDRERVMLYIDSWWIGFWQSRYENYEIGFTTLTKDQITHWMRLPEAP